ncbi:MAG: hypothetical protein AAB116_19840 [Candidatus Poribacteria bacterium]
MDFSVAEIAARREFEELARADEATHEEYERGIKEKAFNRAFPEKDRQNEVIHET